MRHKYNGGFVVSPERIATIEDDLKDLSKRVENIERRMKEDKEEQRKKLKAELEYAKFRCSLENIK